MSPRTVVVAGTHSGVGKTSLACGLMVALRQKGLTVQAFKVGPDFLDPMHHEAATGRPSINLDGWMLNKRQVLDTFHRHTVDADVAVVEGVMGLFDSRDGKSEDGSTAQIAKWLGAPVLLVIDCYAMARSVAAMVKGYTTFDPEVHITGLLLNKVGGVGHGVWLREALQAAGQTARVLGCIPKNDLVAVPERYLGLTMPHEQQQQQGRQHQHQQQQQPLPSYLARVGQLVAEHVDLDLLLQLAETAAAAASDGSSSGSSAVVAQIHDVPRSLSRCRIAIAKDDAFCFYYHDNISLLRAAGAEITLFSPLHDTSLPDDISGIYLGGGYPERFVTDLSKNASMMKQIKGFVDSGGVIYAECGGLLYLSQGLWSNNLAAEPGSSSSSNGSSGSSSSSDNRELIPLVGVFPFGIQMGKMTMGYVEVTVLHDNPLFPAGAVARGQVYHFSEIVHRHSATPAAAAAAAAGSSQAGNGSSSSGDGPSTAAAAAECDQHADGSGIDATGAGSSSVGGSSSSSSIGGSTSSSSSSSMRVTYSTLQLLPGAVAALEGYCINNALASYVHLHWGGCPEFAATFVDKCSSSSMHSSTVTSKVITPKCIDSSSSSSNCVDAPSQGVTNDPSNYQTSIPDYSSTGSSSSSGLGQIVTRSISNDSSNNSNNESIGTGQLLEATTIAAAAAAAAADDDDDGKQQACQYCHSSSSNSSSSSSIVSLLPSGTEILYALGLADRLVAVSGFCDWPPEALLKPKAVRSLVDVENMTSDEIEAQMQAFKAAGQSPFAIDADIITQNKPGLILTQDACATCDADSSLICQTLKQAGLNPNDTHVLVLHPSTLAQVLESITSVAAAAAGSSLSSSSSSDGVVDRAQLLVHELQHRLAAVAAAVAGICPAAGAVTDRCTAAAAAAEGPSWYSSSSRPATIRLSNLQRAAAQPQQQQQGLATAAVPPQPWDLARPARVLSLEGLNPLVLGGQWLPDVKLAAGCVDATGQTPGDKPKRITWQDVLEAAPDVLLLCPCSRSTAAALPDVQQLTRLPGFSSLPAVQSGRVYVIDHGLYSRPGPRLIDGVELLAKLVYGVEGESTAAAAAVSCAGVQGSHGQQQQQQQQHDMRCEPVLMIRIDPGSGDVEWVPCKV